MATNNHNLSSIISSVRPALSAQPTSEEEREKFLYDLVREVYEHVKFDLGTPGDTEERTRIGKVADAALPQSRVS